MHSFTLGIPVIPIIAAESGLESLIKEAPHLGFLGGIVGIVGLILTSATLILYGFTRKFDAWKPPRNAALEGLDMMITGLCAISLVALWLFATPNNIVEYVQRAFKLIGLGIGAYILYVGLRSSLGRYRKPRVGDNQPVDGEVIWGGFWLTPAARAEYHAGESIQDILAGKSYKVDKVWPGSSLAVASMSTAIVLLAVVAGGTIGLSSIATAAQVALTKKPAVEVLGSSQVPGLPTPTPSPSPTSSPSNTSEQSGAKPSATPSN